VQTHLWLRPIFWLDFLGYPALRNLNAVSPYHRDGNEQLIAPIFLDAHGGCSAELGHQRDIVLGQNSRAGSPNNMVINKVGRLNSGVRDWTSSRMESLFSTLFQQRARRGKYVGRRLVSSPGVREQRSQINPIENTGGQSVGVGKGEIYESHWTLDDVTLYARSTRPKRAADWPSESGDGRSLVSKAHKRYGSGRLQSVCLG
jgi:hypothetical protein